MPRRGKRIRRRYRTRVGINAYSRNIIKGSHRSNGSKVSTATYSTNARMVLMPMSFPDSIMTKVRYNTSKNIPINNANEATYIYFRGNGPYDPDVASGGYFPYYWENYALLYDRYTCFGSKIKVSYVATGDTRAGQVFSYGIIPTLEGSTLPPTISRASEVPYAKHKYSRVDTSAVVPVISMWKETSKLFGISNNKVKIDDRYSALTNSSVPSSEWKWAVFAGYPVGTLSTAQTNVQIDVQITYYVKFWQRAELPSRVEVPVDGPQGTQGPAD